MRRTPVLLLTVLLAACATKPARVAPEPVAHRDGQQSRRAADSTGLPARPVLPGLPAILIDSAAGDSAIDAEIAAELESAADSVADDAALEELATADAPEKTQIATSVISHRNPASQLSAP